MDFTFLDTFAGKFPLVSIQQIGLAVSASLGAGYGIYKFVWKPGSRLLKKLKEAHVKLMDSLPILENIAAEFKPNGGSSLRDAINRLESGVSEVVQKNRIIASEMKIACFETDKHGMCIWVSPKWQEFTGLASDKSLGNGWINAICPDDRDRVFDEWAHCLEQGRDFSLDYCVNPESPRPMRGYSYFIKDRKGNLIGMIGTLSEIPE